MKKILLVAPAPLKFDLTQDDSYLKVPLTKARSFLAPLHIATVAGLTPDGFEVELWDEAVQGPLEQRTDIEKYDLVGLTGYTAHLPRALVVSRYVREKGIPVAIGGPGISSAPFRYRDDFDIFFIGEAELTWPQFLKDWENGRHRKIYRQVGQVDMALSPLPRWDSIAEHLQYYHVGGVQTSRGCPFDCEFCDVRNLFGSRFRHKPIENVLKEIAALEKYGVNRIVFCDDNFYGNPRYTKELLREMIRLNSSFETPLGFAGEMSINIASDEEMLKLLADANFIEVFIGIESPNKESLKASNKIQNVRSDLVEDIKKIQSYGISVRGSLIVGFDDDEKDIFDMHFRFIQESCLTVPSIRVLMAPPGTRLWKRLLRENRLLRIEEGRYYGNPGTTNILPKKMTRVELHSGYLELISRVYDWKNFASRIKGFVANIQYRPSVRQDLPLSKYRQFIRFILKSFAPGDKDALLGAIRYTREHAPHMLPRLIGITLRNYGYAVRPALHESIRNQIEQEESGLRPIEIEECGVLVPDEFREPYREIFPHVRQLVSEKLNNELYLDETLVEIFTEFICRWRQSLKEFTTDHSKSLMQLAESIVDERNGSFAPDDQPMAMPEKIVLPVAGTERRMADDVLKSVEVELIGR